ncbi:hypothetical protein EBQ26_11075 [Allofranklinella schreckenbergeri]|uniref:Uncharacterized protein n=1 Tax=Allofranklinella schreckenbergeri TaxID=1076744 RepID=A0A3M6PZ23_9BURK|nr:hypothetical protein EBQ26_11075 [Allofranklinella schreckenbergeri]
MDGQALGPVVGGVAACVLAGVCTFNEKDESNSSEPTPPVPIPEDWKGDTCPAPDWTWSGPDEPGGERGAWISPDKRHSYHADNDHPPPIGPHVDWNDKLGNRRWRIFPDGKIEPK